MAVVYLILAFVAVAMANSHRELLAAFISSANSTANATSEIADDLLPVHNVTCDGGLDDDAAINCCNHLNSCNDFIEPGGTKYGISNLSNDTLYTCECSLEFRDCLHRANHTTLYKSTIYDELGKAYFDSVPRKCFLKIYNVFCHGLFYDDQENIYEDNLEERYFCPVLLKSKGFYQRLVGS